MKKLSINISPEEWGNLVTKYNADSQKVKIADFTDGTVNIDTDITGSITKCKGSINYNGTTLAAAPKDQFEAIFSDGARHLLVVQSGEVKYSSGDTVFNAVVNGTGFSSSANFEFATTQDRVYGGNATDDPIVYDRSISYGGVGYTAPQIKDMGAQAPSSAPTAGAPTAGGSVPDGAHTYKVTYLYYDFEESNGSPASGVQTAGAGNNTIPLSSIPIGGYGVTARKIYRDDNDGLYLHIATLADNTTTVFNDTINVGATPTEIPQFNNAPPSFGLVTLWIDKLWASKVPGDPYTLFHSETGMPDIFRPENQILCNQEDPITAHVVYYDRLIVFNRRSMGQILGKTSDTFRYAAIPSSVGCVDNRTLQTRVVEGVPVLIWLSDRGFYSYDGNAIDYISDPIEDLVNFNIQQAVQQKNSNTQTSQAHFQGGTSSQGIDLLSVPGSITTKGYSDGTSVAGTNPRRNFDDQSDWEAGSVNTNTVTRDGTNKIKVPTNLTNDWYRRVILPANGQPQGFFGTFSGVQEANQQVSGSGTPADPLILTWDQINLQSSIAYSGGSNLSSGFFTQPVQLANYFVQKFTIPRSGTVTSLSLRLRDQVSNGSAEKGRFAIFSDFGGSPLTLLFTSSTFTVPSNASSELVTLSVSFPLSAGTYWIGIENRNAADTGLSDALSPNGSFSTFSGMASPVSTKYFRLGVWNNYTTAPFSMAMDFCTTPVARSGQWISPIKDTQSIYVSPTISIVLPSTSYPSGSTCAGAYTTGSILALEGSNSSTFNSGEDPSPISESFNNVSGTQNYTISGKRYWRIRITLSTNNDIFVPSVGVPNLRFNQTATWTSQAIDATSDVTSYDSLTIIDNIPSGTSIVYTVATSNDDITYPDGFVTFGTEVTRRYIKIKAVLSLDSTYAITPDLSSITLKWTISANFVSAPIDTAATPPAGWDTFLTSEQANGGTISYQMRSATTLGGLSAATFFNVSPSSLPSSVTPLQFVQWKVIITSSDNSVPQVDSVTVQWLISEIDSIRPASIFVDGRYYVALAESEQTTNNIILYLDLKGKWRRRSDLAISTFSYFFNRPYFGLASSGQIRKFLEGDTNAGAVIPFDVRTKAVDYSTAYQNYSSSVKVVGEVILSGINTGATIQLLYSVDDGQTFVTMLTSSGASSYVTTTDGKNFFARFRPVWDGSNAISGRSIIYRIINSDANPVEITGLEALAFLRAQSPVITG